PAPGHERDEGGAAGPGLPPPASDAPRGDGEADPRPTAGAARGDGPDRGAAGAAADQRGPGVSAGQPGQVAVEHLYEDAGGGQDVQPGDGRLRVPGGGADGGRLLPRAG